MLEKLKYDIDFEKYSNSREFKKILKRAKDKKSFLEKVEEI